LSEIKHAYPLILNKVASPHYATPILRRARLLDWLNQAADCRAVVLAADAGYGKTTLLWQWEREAEFPCYWYKLDRTDRDWTFHISYLIEAIAKRHKGFGRRAHSMLEQMGGPGTSRPGVAAYLLAEMHQRLTEPCTFIIDDWQYVNAVTEVRGFWNQILRDAPPTCRFVFASRAKPRLQFARFKTHGGYAELRTDTLRFTEPEIAELFRDIYNDPLEPSELTELERRTEGWAASLQLVEVSLRERSSPNERHEFISSITAASDSDLFDFLAEEVLDQQPAETRNFLLTTSILQQITPEVAERLAGVHDGRRELTNLEQHGLFTNRLDDDRYRYHNLFRDFLERWLIEERSEAEVMGLHIHAASYFETTEQWPEAIHHYLRAGLQRQAARLIAKYGEDVVSSGRLGLVDEWLLQLPAESIKQNARLSLLHGEARGIRGDWRAALDALQHAREFFSRRGDRRMEALACLKLSTVYSNYGDTDSAARVADAGVELVPADDVSTRLRLEGNVAITRTYLSGPAAEVVQECLRVAEEANALGLEHYAAIGYHNAGQVQLRMGHVTDAIRNLERASAFWTEGPTSPFGDNEDLAEALTLDGKLERARAIATTAVKRCSPWARPRSCALYGLAGVLAAEGKLREAIIAIREATTSPTILGATHAVTFARMIELIYLEERESAAIAHPWRLLNDGPLDPRFEAEMAPAAAIADHLDGTCNGKCQRRLRTLLAAERRGARLIARLGRVKIGALALEHRSVRSERAAWNALADAAADGFLAPLRPWARRYAPYVRHALDIDRGSALLAVLVRWDPDGWRSAVIGILEELPPSARVDMLDSIVKHANRETPDALKQVRGADVLAARRHLQVTQASRMYLRTFGALTLRRGSWDGPPIPIEKRRVRALLGVLGAHAHATLTRDKAIELLWPEADGDSAINNLNQTVFQLRRYLDPSYRQGESAEYVISSSEHVGLNSELVRTDLQTLRGLPGRLASATWPDRQTIAAKAIALIGGEFLADLPYESWTARLQVTVHNDIRALLLPIALQADQGYDIQVGISAASALVSMDPFDEAATLALADLLGRSGRRVAARELLVRYADQLTAELDGESIDSGKSKTSRRQSNLNVPG
jgi:ATP/maltotriose-dependent transcriptional regulator MalT/DNA-binding SARP family transcriptional activator